MLNLAGKTFLVIVLSPILCVGVLIMFVAAVCDFAMCRMKASVPAQPVAHRTTVDK